MSALAATATSKDAATGVVPPKVLVGMSGGVDSSVAAALLVERGFEVVGSMLRFWPDDRPEGAFDLCCSPDAAYDARRVADELDVPFYLLDFRDRFQEVVVDPFVPGYQAGTTPNPCVWCNREIKFGAFVKRAQALGCEFMATGHYVRRVDGPDGPELHRGVDDDKDQTYFLWALPREVLPYLLFPLGDMTKAEVRRVAAEKDLLTAEKPSSSGLCFVPTTVKDYLAAALQPRPGDVLDAADGYEVAGRHDGVARFTIGQRKGLGLKRSHLERYVIELRPETNEVVVGTKEMCHWPRLVAERRNFLCAEDDLPDRVMAQVRYRQAPEPATLRLLDGDRFELVFDEPQFAVAVGQSAVVYSGDRLLGGGVIAERHR
ncbi:MAG TPA: tRNA 2-thiouridine(34) synthase MnmA [Trueperaceae bacterium]|nr:tRNA 2-thiouridine(34) synthase MnmA [Trueperaceae bacterium]